MAIRKSAQDRRREIERAALMLAFRHGPQKVTTGMIAAELKLTQPALYKHFPKKDDIWAAVAQYLSRRIARNVALADDAALAPEARLKKLVLGHLRLVRENPALPEFMVIRDTRKGHVLLRASIQDAMTEFRSALEVNVVSAIRTGAFRASLDAGDGATLIFGVIQSLVLRMMVTRDPDILTRDAERLLDLQLAGFAPQGGSR